MNTSLFDNKIKHKFCYGVNGDVRILYVSFCNCIRLTSFGSNPCTSRVTPVWCVNP
nr:MAG TPA: hypothetical protein [Inoviridae sp.]